MKTKTDPHRRDFLKTSSATAAAALAFPTVTLGKPNSAKLKVGWVGCEHCARYLHAECAALRLSIGKAEVMALLEATLSAAGKVQWEKRKGEIRAKNAENGLREAAGLTER